MSFKDNNNVVSRDLPTQESINQELPNPTPPVVRINADSQQPKKVVCLWVLIVLAIIILLVVALSLPQTVEHKINKQAFKQNKGQCNNPVSFDEKALVRCRQYSSNNPIVGLVLRQVKDINQFYIIYLLLTVPKQLNITTINQTVKVKFYALNRFTYFGQNGRRVQYRYQKSILDTTFVLSRQLFKTKIQPNEDDGDSIVMEAVVGFARQFIGSDQKNYLLTLEFQQSNDLRRISNMQMIGEGLNGDFTIFTIVIRFTFMAIGIVTGVIYLRRYKQIEPSERIVEMKLVAVLSVAVLIFNDPLYPITVLLPNSVTTFISVLFLITFLVFLMGFWIIFLSRMCFESLEKNSKIFTPRGSWLKIIYLWLFFAILIAMYSTYGYQILNKTPILTEQALQQPKFLIVTILALIFLAIGLLWVFILYIIAIIKWVKQQIQWREKQFVILLPFFYSIYIIGIVTGGNIINSYKAVQILYSYSFLNLYVFILQYMYYVPLQSLEQMQANTNNSIIQLDTKSIQEGAD